MLSTVWPQSVMCAELRFIFNYFQQLFFSHSKVYSWQEAENEWAVAATAAVSMEAKNKKCSAGVLYFNMCLIMKYDKKNLIKHLVFKHVTVQTNFRLDLQRTEWWWWIHGEERILRVTIVNHEGPEPWTMCLCPGSDLYLLASTQWVFFWLLF